MIALAGALAAGLAMPSPGFAAGALRHRLVDETVVLAQTPSQGTARKKRVECRDQRPQNSDQRARSKRQRGQPARPAVTECPPQQPDWFLERTGPETRWPLDW